MSLLFVLVLLLVLDHWRARQRAITLVAQVSNLLYRGLQACMGVVSELDSHLQSSGFPGPAERSRLEVSDTAGWKPALLTSALLLTLLSLTSCAPRTENSVVIYTSQDKVYAERIFADFTRETGIEVRAVYDSEAVKTVGLVNRLIAEKNHPQCDVFWNNEELRTRQLEAEGVLGANRWKQFGYRSRQIVFNTNQVQTSAAPKSLLELTNAAWRGKVVIAYPMFGTTATHFLALRQHWGEAGWEAWCRALQNNGAKVVDGNSVVVKLVASGEAAIGLTDSDDIAAGQREGLPIAGLTPAETFYIRNTVALIREPATPAAERLFDYLSRPDVVERLVTANAIEGIAPPDAGIAPKDWPRLLRDLEPATTTLKQIFLRQTAYSPIHTANPPPFPSREGPGVGSRRALRIVSALRGNRPSLSPQRGEGPRVRGGYTFGVISSLRGNNLPLSPRERVGVRGNEASFHR
ncbi:MAG: substrate-binding domain-containing protein [Verrucomicrobiota bacterium]